MMNIMGVLVSPMSERTDAIREVDTTASLGHSGNEDEKAHVVELETERSSV